jgi:hypothetical protein
VRAATKLLELAAALARGREGRGTVVNDLARSLAETGELRRAEEFLHEVASDSRFASLELASLRDYTAADADSFGALEQAADPKDSDTGDAKARAAILKAEVQWTKGRYGEMDASLATAREAANGLDDSTEKQFLLNSIVGWTARALLLGPKPAEDGLTDCETLLEEANGSHAAEAAVLAVKAGLHAMRDDFGQAREDYRRSRQIGEAFGLGAWLAALPLYSGPVELLAGRPADAERQLRRGYDALEGMGDKSRRSTVAAFLAHALYEQHQDGEAEKFARISKKLAAEDDAFTQVVWRGALAKVLARCCDCDRALAHAQKAVALTDEINDHARNLRGDALLDLAKVLMRCGSAKDARATAEDALDPYRAKGNEAAVRRVKAFIARLPS